MRIGFRERRRGRIDKILIPKRAEVARMLAAPALAPARSAGGGVLARLGRGAAGPARVTIVDAGAGALPRALDLAKAGAAMIALRSTDCGGDLSSIAAARDALDGTFGELRPRLLVEDYFLDPIQLARALGAGADAVLLIARLVAPEVLARLVDAARSLGLEPVVEIADDEELASARAFGARAVAVTAVDRDNGKIDLDDAAARLAKITGAVTILATGGAALDWAIAARADAVIAPSLAPPDGPRDKPGA